MTQQHPQEGPRSASHVYVLRVWHDGDAALPGWRATLREDTQGDARHFASIDDCLEYLYGVLLRS
ncbi:hypothetical protein [Deinococcus pimensis]|uniref:hypothetical protein n=1 Tax=Deinococcus pimensis TaxID=309888 RepID=UPI0004838F85|nr:hypothetical protein [Deinococcus pimensis]